VDGQIAVRDIVAMEILTSAQGHAEFLVQEEALAACTWVKVEPADRDRARGVYRELARRPLRHRAVSIPDLLIAAAAERSGLMVVHDDEDDDRSAAVTARPVRWAAPWLPVTGGGLPEGRARACLW